MTHAQKRTMRGPLSLSPSRFCVLNRVVRVRRIRISIRKRKGITTPYWNMYAIGEDGKNFDLSNANTV